MYRCQSLLLATVISVTACVSWQEAKARQFPTTAVAINAPIRIVAGPPTKRSGAAQANFFRGLLKTLNEHFQPLPVGAAAAVPSGEAAASSPAPAQINLPRPPKF